MFLLFCATTNLARAQVVSSEQPTIEEAQALIKKKMQDKKEEIRKKNRKIYEKIWKQTKRFVVLFVL
jgi:hypothetical protein